MASDGFGEKNYKHIMYEKLVSQPEDIYSKKYFFQTALFIL